MRPFAPLPCEGIVSDKGVMTGLEILALGLAGVVVLFLRRAGW